MPKQYSDYTKERYIEAVDEWLAKGEPILQFHEYLIEYESKLIEDYDESMWIRGETWITN